MQTFLPYANFRKSAKVLDNKRLGNQCYRECVTLFNGKWKNHPASKMWINHKDHLARYALELAKEMGARNKWKPEVVKRWVDFWQQKTKQEPKTPIPSWLGNIRFHLSHQSNLLRKDPGFYKTRFPNVPDNLPYIWPIK